MAIFLAALLHLTIADKLTCDKYQCNKGDMNLSADTCVYFLENVYYLQLCDPTTVNSYCPPVFSQTNSTCTTPPSKTDKTAWPGEKCQDDAWCNYGFCYQGYCQGQVLGAICMTHDECNPGLRCYNGRCYNQIETGNSGCSDDFDCKNDAGCDVGVCKKLFSVKNRDWVSACLGSQTNYMCSSGFCYEGVCIDPPNNDQDIPQICTQDTDCLSTDYQDSDGILFYSTCTCGYNKQGVAYCSLFEGDDPAQDKTKWYKQWVKQDGIHRCNTSRRFSRNCIEQFWSSEQAEMMDYYTTLADNYARIEESDSCAKKIAFDEYYQEYDDMNSSSGLLTSMIMILGFMIQVLQ